jgi:hypothetical protein
MRSPRDPLPLLRVLATEPAGRPTPPLRRAADSVGDEVDSGPGTGREAIQRPPEEAQPEAEGGVKHPDWVPCPVCNHMRYYHQSVYQSPAGDGRDGIKGRHGFACMTIGCRCFLTELFKNSPQGDLFKED